MSAGGPLPVSLLGVLANGDGGQLWCGPSTVTNFIRDTVEFRATDPLRTNIIGSVAATFALKGDFEAASWFWLTVREEESAGMVIGIAVRTGRNPFILSPMSEAAANALATYIASVDDDFPGVTGPTSVVECFLIAYRANGSAGSTRKHKLKFSLNLYELGVLLKPIVKGRPRQMTLADIDVAVDLLTQFVLETKAGGVADVAAAVRMKIEHKLFYFWLDEEENIVAFGGHALLVETPSGLIGRIGPVFTLPSERGKRYASAITSFLAEMLQEKCSKILLYADAVNVASNKVYTNLGFNYVDNSIEYDMINEY